MPQASIIIPAYNEEESIEKTLKSLKNQTYEDYELIVINNNSTDNTEKIAKKYTNKVFLEKKRGYHNAANRGVKESKGKIIAICDADSLYPPHWLKRIMNEFKKNPDIVAVYGSAKFHDHDFFVNLLSNVGFTFFMRLSKILGFDNTPGFNFAMKKSAYKQVGGYSPKIYDSILTDVELGKRLQKIGKLKQDPKLTVYTSSRRFKEDGLFKTTLYFLDAWYRLNYGKPQKISYKQYNITYDKKQNQNKQVIQWLNEIKRILKKGREELEKKQRILKKEGIKTASTAIQRVNTAIFFTNAQIKPLIKIISSNNKNNTETSKKKKRRKK